MITVEIRDAKDDRYPFSREVYENSQIVYHGTWSIYSTAIEVLGFGGVTLPFDHNDFNIIGDAWRRAGTLKSYADVLFYDQGPDRPRTELSMTGNFWHARAYATDGGGEAVRLMLKEARGFEALCTNDQTRVALKSRWENGLKQSPGHRATMAAVEFLGNKFALEEACSQVRAARERIENVVKGGFPLVYAVRIDPAWFSDTWEEYIEEFEDGDRTSIELRCARDFITADRLIAKASYPNGTDGDFLGEWLGSWAEVVALAQEQQERE